MQILIEGRHEIIFRKYLYKIVEQFSSTQREDQGVKEDSILAILLESSGGLFMDTSTLLHVYVDVDILFNSHIHDAGFYFDAARVVLAAEASGIPPENIRLYSKVRSISPTSYFFC